MSMLSFMPWCQIETRYEAGEITILPFTRHTAIDGLDEVSQCKVNTIMAVYKDLEGKPVRNAAIVRYGSKSLIDDLDDEEVEIAQDIAGLTCFTGLAKREYFNALGHYCNSDCFALFFQKFDNAAFTALSTRRREGQTLNGWPIDYISITIPVHCHSIQQVSLDVDLLNALVNHRSQLKDGEWGRWQNSITCFNQANTDSDNIRYQVEWVLLCSAFEHLLGANSNANDISQKFDKAISPSNILGAKDSIRLSGQQQKSGQSLRCEWMREFYRIRGDFAHGKLNTQQRTFWNPLEHLVLATIAFPLVAKSLLIQVSKYELTDNDRAQIDIFEKFADTSDFLKSPSDQSGSIDSHWKRLVDKRLSNIGMERAVNQAWSDLTPEQRQCFDGGQEKEDL